jgi:hypothetical protein
MIMAVFVLFILLVISRLNCSCIRCMRFVYSAVHGVYILYTAIADQSGIVTTHLTRRLKNTLTNKQFEQ